MQSQAPAPVSNIVTSGAQPVIGSEQNASVAAPDEDCTYDSDQDAEGETDDEYEAHHNFGFENSAQPSVDQPSTPVYPVHADSEATPSSDNAAITETKLKSILKPTTPLPSQAPTTASSAPTAPRVRPGIVLHLDKPWSFLTWNSRANREEMLDLLEAAGEDTTGLKARNRAHEIINYIMARRERRVAAGLVPAVKIRIPRKNKVKAATTVEKERNKAVLAPAVVEKTKGKDRPSSPLTRPAGIKKRAIATKKLRFPQSAAIAPRDDIRTHLLAIAKQVDDDEATNESKGDGYQRKTLLNGLPLSMETQLLVRDLLGYRKRARKSRVDADEAEHKHGELGRRLAEAVQEETGGMDEAVELVEEVFGIEEED